MISNRALALTATPSSKVISNNLKAIYKVREAFIASENSEKMRRALAHNIRTSGDILQETMFTSNMQTAENGMAQRQYYSKIGSNFSSKMEVLTSESTLVDLS